MALDDVIRKAGRNASPVRQAQASQRRFEQGRASAQDVQLASFLRGVSGQDGTSQGQYGRDKIAEIQRMLNQNPVNAAQEATRNSGAIRSVLASKDAPSFQVGGAAEAADRLGGSERGAAAAADRLGGGRPLAAVSDAGRSAAAMSQVAGGMGGARDAGQNVDAVRRLLAVLAALREQGSGALPGGSIGASLAPGGGIGRSIGTVR
jgi:hypothetical protein